MNASEKSMALPIKPRMLKSRTFEAHTTLDIHKLTTVLCKLFPSVIFGIFVSRKRVLIRQTDKSLLYVYSVWT